MMGPATDFDCLFSTSSEQSGHFTSAQAKSCGYAASLLTYHTRKGTFTRIHRGVYRLRNYPTTPYDEVMAAWLAVGRDRAVASHETALELLDLSDVIPSAINFTVPRSIRHLPDLTGVKIHTTTLPLAPSDTQIRDGIRATSAARTILDVAATGIAPEQVELAVRQSLQRGLATRGQLERGARLRSARVSALILGAIQTEKP